MKDFEPLKITKGNISISINLHCIQEVADSGKNDGTLVLRLSNGETQAIDKTDADRVRQEFADFLRDEECRNALIEWLETD